MKTNKYWMTMMAGIVLALTACTNEDTPQPEVSGDYLTATATAPAEAFGSLSRASEVSYSDLTLHYTNAQTDDLTAFAVAGYSITPSTDNNVTTLTFTTKGEGTEGSTSLVWPQIKEGTPLYLTVSTTGEEKQLWGTCTPAHGAALDFDDLKPRYTKLSVAVTVNSTTALTEGNTLTVSANIKAAADAAVASTQAWPTGDAATTTIGKATAVTLTENTDSKQGTATVSDIFAPQTLEEPLSFEYAGGSWTLDLSKIAVTGGTDGQMANELVAGQHLTVSVTLNMTTLGTPTVTLTDISAATDSYTGGLSGAATYTVTYGETTVTCADLNALTDALTAAITAGATDISITGNISSFVAEMIVALAEDKTLTVNGKQTRFYMGTNKTADDLQSKIAAAVAAGAKAITVTGDLTAEQQAAVKSGIEKGTGIHLSLPQTTAVGYQAFYKCSALTEITLEDVTEIGTSAFFQCTSLATVNGTLSGTIGIYAFCYCSALTEITLGDGAEIGESAFAYCTNLKTVEGTLSGIIGNCAFFGCSALKEITLEDGTEIGYGAFADCTGMTSLTLQGVVTEVGTDAFSSVGYKNNDYNCALTLASGQAYVEGLAPDVENKTWAGNTWKSITIPSTNE